MNIKIYKSDHFSLRVNFGLWVLYEIAIAACDLAEVLGSAIIALYMYNSPKCKGFRYTEAFVILLVASVMYFFLFSMSSQFIYTRLICNQTG
ncbi:hypothetical protein [Nostoc sp.]|uniref:hypothetical protein n=1 Tax=Nostoc sp. TaxID=1180 RepID=UPI003593E058